MNKREFKKAITSLGSSICVQMFIIASTKKDIDNDKINECIDRVWSAQVRAKQNANIFFGRPAKDFENPHLYRVAKDQFYTKLFDKINAEFGAQVDDALKAFNAAAGTAEA